MVAEPTWILKMGNQVSNRNLKNNTKTTTTTNNNPTVAREKRTIGILAFEVANVMSKTVHLHKSLTDPEISNLKARAFTSQGVHNLVSQDQNFLLQLALAEKLDDLNKVATAVSRLGKKCVEPALQGFEHVYGDIVNGAIDVRELGFLVKDMDAMVRKMERYISSTTNLYSEMEVLSELEQATKKFQVNQHEESRRAFEQKVVWQRQDVKHLKEVSFWGQSFDKVVELLARTVCTVYARISFVFGETVVGVVSGWSRRAVSQGNDDGSRLKSGAMERGVVERRGSGVRPLVELQKGSELGMFQGEDLIFPCGTIPGRLFMDCLSLSSAAHDDDYDGGTADNDDRSSQISSCSIANSGFRRELAGYSGCSTRIRGCDRRQARCGGLDGVQFGPKSRVMAYASPSTVGGSALALHYANVIIVIEKLLRYPHLVREEARDDLYQMLPTSLRMSLRTNLKSYVKNLAIYDAPLAHDWKETLDGILKWLAPMAHNMIRWQSERNFEQHQIVKRTNVLLLQTLFFADREKTEAAICQLLVGLNYICRYEHQQNALLDCASSFDFEDCMQWQLQCRGAFLEQID